MSFYRDHLQRPFKHSFKQQFDSYTTKNIEKQIGEKELKDVKLDTKMTTLKPHLCSWLLQAWGYVNKPKMISRGWEMCGLDRAFNQAFQTSAMDEHMKKSLFKDEASEAEPNSRENDEEIDTDIPIEAIMEQSLHHAAEVATANQPKVASLKQLARKRYGFIHLVVDLCWYELST
jgi:hypothetical protein